MSNQQEPDNPAPEPWRKGWPRRWPDALGRFIQFPNWERAREAWEAHPEFVLEFLNVAAGSSEYRDYYPASQLLAALPGNLDFHDAALKLLSNEVGFIRRYAAESLYKHGRTADCPVLIELARTDPEEYVRAACLWSYVTLAEEIDEEEVQARFSELHCAFTSWIASSIADRREPHLLPLIRREAEQCLEDMDYEGSANDRLRFSLARWQLGEDELAEEILLFGLDADEDDMDEWLYALEVVDCEVDLDPARATPQLCHAVRSAIEHVPRLETQELARTIEICRVKRRVIR